MDFVAEYGKNIENENRSSTLVLPALSIGNVGQLAMDLLVASLKAERIGYLDDPYVLPCVGNDAYGPVPSGEIALPLEVYSSDINGLTLVQQRSLVVKGKMVEFARHVADFAAKSGKKHVVLLSSLDFGCWQNIDLSSGLQVFYLSSLNDDGSNPECETLGWKRLQDYEPNQRGWEYLRALAEANDGQNVSSPFEDDEEEEEDYYPSLPFAALFSCLKANGLKVTCLLCCCSEGDNIPEALHLGEAARKYVALHSKEDALNSPQLLVSIHRKCGLPANAPGRCQRSTPKEAHKISSSSEKMDLKSYYPNTEILSTCASGFYSVKNS